MTHGYIIEQLICQRFINISQFALHAGVHRQRIDQQLKTKKMRPATIIWYADKLGMTHSSLREILDYNMN